MKDEKLNNESKTQIKAEPSKMIRHFLKMKEQYSDCLVFYRLGDFYELFFEDAETVSKELGLVLTGKDCGMEQRAPMCGIPHHVVLQYLTKLTARGYKIAICEQLSDPKASRGLVDRDVVRIVTPGTVIDEGLLSEDRNNFIASVYMGDDCVGVAWSDISTGECNYNYFDGNTAMPLNDLLSRIEPKEIICNRKMAVESINLSVVKFGKICPFTMYDDIAYEFDNAKKSVASLIRGEFFDKLLSLPACICAMGALFDYVEKTQKRVLKHLSHARFDAENKYLILETTARRTLELTETAEGKKYGSLLWLIDNTSTPMGKRLLRRQIEQPDLDETVINSKLDAVGELLKEQIIRDELFGKLKNIRDLERLTGRLSYGNMTPKDCVALMQSLEVIPDVKRRLSALKSDFFDMINEHLDTADEEYKLLFDGIDPSPAISPKDGSVIKKGFDGELDDLRDTAINSKSFLANLEAKEKELTKIKNLKIGFNKVFGYYIEVSNSQKSLVPYRYMRKQTTAGGERYITEELKILEQKILRGEEMIAIKETELFEGILRQLAKSVEKLLTNARMIAGLDCVVSNAITAFKNGYIRPTIGKGIKHIKIIEGRHPVVEKTLKGESFVPNDTMLDNDGNRTMLITGPNMAGKSVYMRQVALIVIMSHIGSFVPAKSAEIALTDKIFTRVGASDDISTGRSTFMVEMSEVSAILRNVTDDSLLLLDEIGRGTSTYDGLSIAWSILEYLSKNTKAKTIFSTHYHELTELEGNVDGLKNYKLTVKELGNSIYFLRKMMRGSANRSFGIEVASLAGLPEIVVDKAKQLLKSLEKNDITRKSNMATTQQISIFGDNKMTEIRKILKELDIDGISPRTALEILSDLKEKVELDG